MKKFELTSESVSFAGRKLFRIKALIDFGGIKAGDLGGFIEKEENLSQKGNAWVYDDARVYDNAYIRNNASVRGKAKIYGNAIVSGDAQIFDNIYVYDNAYVSDNARIYEDAWVYGNAEVFDEAEVFGDVEVRGNAKVHGNAQIADDADLLQIIGLGLHHRATTVFTTTDEVKVSCGCFFGTVAEFEQQIKEELEGKVQAEYLKFVELIKIYFEEE